jgi:phospholipase C
MVPSERYSDHPGSAWFGAWYLSETLDILTKNPEVWKKTVFILTYDENDGYFDHVPPYVAPDPRRPETGSVSSGIDASLEFVTLEQDRQWHPFQARESSIGLGYRVPMVIASPWSRGGAVCSQVFDHTSVLQFMEKVLSHQTGKTVREPNISRWRRTVCGDLTAAFKSPQDISSPLSPVDHEVFVSEIHQAKFKQPPSDFRALSDEELLQLKKGPELIPSMPKQEPGLRPACPLPYDLGVSGAINVAQDSLTIRLQARKDYFKDQAAGAAFTAYVFTQGNQFQVRNYAVEAGESVEDYWRLEDFSDGTYRIHIHGPNGYFWVLSGNRLDPQLEVSMLPLGGNAGQEVHLRLLSQSPQETQKASIQDNAYGNTAQIIEIA